MSVVASLLRDDPHRWPVLNLVRVVVPDGFIAAGCIRNAVWDHRHDRSASRPTTDIDVIWHDARLADPCEDRRREAALRDLAPNVRWSVRNQARMHVRNGDPPYGSVADAMRFWPETATAVAARRGASGGCEIVAPFGLDDLLDLVLRPGPAFAGARRSRFDARVREKRWLEHWPLLTIP